MKPKQIPIIIAIILIILLTPVLAIIMNEDHTTKISEKYASKPELNKDIHQFLNNNEPLGKEFTEEEKQHMQDVKILVLTAKILFVLSCTTIIFLRPTLKELKIALIISLIILTTILIFTITNFQTTFTSFHKMFFQDGTWTFPSQSTLLQIYPKQFFIETSTTWFIISTGISLILLASSLLLSYYKRAC